MKHQQLLQNKHKFIW